MEGPHDFCKMVVLDLELLPQKLDLKGPTVVNLISGVTPHFLALVCPWINVNLLFRM
jgi:hypothetical protein